MKRLATILVYVTIGMFLLIFTFGWLNANVDSYNYYAIGEYFRTGTYPFQEPFVYNRPTTISPPLYGLFLAALQAIPRSDIPIHAIQLILLGLSSFLLYRLLRQSISEPIARIIGCLFAMTPVNIIYAGSLMTEIPAQSIVMLWLFFIIDGVKHRDSNPIGLALCVAALGTLLKYNLGIYIPLSLVLYLYYWQQTQHRRLLMPIAGLLLIGVWIGANHVITGTWGLYDTRGTQLYNQFIAQTKLLPPDTDQSVIRMRQLLPEGTDIAVYYWDIQEQLSEQLDHEWLAVDRVLFDVAWASVKTHPIQYILHSIRNYGSIHYDHVPHWRNIGNMGRTDVSGIDRPFCGDLGSATTCSPIVPTSVSFSVWNTFIAVEMKLFELFAAPVFFAIFIPSLIALFFIKDRVLRLYLVAYLVGTVPIAFSIHPDPRYVVPFYPIFILACATVIVGIYRRYKNVILD